MFSIPVQSQFINSVSKGSNVVKFSISLQHETGFIGKSTPNCG